VSEFESAVGGYIRNPNCLALNSGTSALQLALRLSDVRPGTEVISSPVTFVATNMSILACGATPVWADVAPASGLVDVQDVKRQITPRTRAILAVDWGGAPSDIAALKEVAAVAGVPVIEDAAQAFGSEQEGVRTGSQADFTCFSFQAIKVITTGDGGMLATRERATYERGRKLRWFGIDRDARTDPLSIELDLPEWGYKFHMNDITAAIGVVQMRFVEGLVSAQRRNAEYLDANLPGFVEPAARAGSSCWLYTALLPDGVTRRGFQEHMKAMGIATSQVHDRNDLYPPFSNSSRELPGVEQFMDRMLCLPCNWSLSGAELEFIAEAAGAFVP
jgi:dTDP-4-amino-4,6-dideoxygalactose transaminase